GADAEARLDLVDAGDAAERLLERFGDRRAHLVGALAPGAHAHSVGRASELAPGRRRSTVTVAGSAFGSRSTARSRNEKLPVTTSDSTSTVVKAGRRTQNSARLSAAARRYRQAPRP